MNYGSDFLTCAQDEKRNHMPTLNWHKREEAVRAATRAPYRLLEPVAELSYGDADSENLLIQGDTLDALKALLPYYAGGRLLQCPRSQGRGLDPIEALRHESENTRPPDLRPTNRRLTVVTYSLH